MINQLENPGPLKAKLRALKPTAIEEKLKSKTQEIERKLEEHAGRWSDSTDQAVKMATLGSISFLAASAAPSINPEIAAAHPAMISFFLVGALLFVFCASTIMMFAFIKEKKVMRKITENIVRVTSFAGVVCFFLGALDAVIFLVLKIP